MEKQKGIEHRGTEVGREDGERVDGKERKGIHHRDTEAQREDGGRGDGRRRKALNTEVQRHGEKMEEEGAEGGERH